MTTGILVPLYTYPSDPSWSEVITQKQLHPATPIACVVNPNSGPGTSRDPEYAVAITNLKAAGIRVLGYDHTSDGGRPLSEVETDIRRYVNWYGVHGIFFDEMSSSPVTLSYYHLLASYAAAQGINFTVGNPGTYVPESMVGIFNVTCIYEMAGMPTGIYLMTHTYKLPPHYFATISDTTSLGQFQTYYPNVAPYAAWIYATDLVGPPPDTNNPYSALPSYFEQLCAI